MVPVICSDGGVFSRSMRGAYIVIVSCEDGAAHLTLKAAVVTMFL
jgi:hypothetical protein